jgi:hypothetical protein
VVVSAFEGLATVGLVVGLICRRLEIVAASSVALLMIATAAAGRHSGEPMSKTLPSLGLVLSAVAIGGQLLMHAL